MEFRLLGPLEIVEGGLPLALPSGRPRALLAMLLLGGGRTVARDDLIDGLWGEAVPDTGVKMIQIYVSQLRRVIPPEVLRTTPPGYVLELEPEQLDLDRFTRLAGEGRAALDVGDPTGAASRLRAALALWRGPALREFPEPFAVAEAARLEELQLAALERRIDADLLCGRAGELVGELEALVAAHPLRERPRAQLMLALYRSGRQAEALAAYQETRRALDEQLGLQPSAELRELEQAILRQDESLDRRVAADAAPAPWERRGSAFVGRDDELARLGAALPRSGSAGGAVLITGAPGIGKTRLAEELAARAADAGLRVAWGRCHDHEAAPPYWPWAEAIRALASGLPAAELEQLAGPDAGVIVRLVPELGERLGGGPAEAADEESQQARFRLFDAVTTLLLRTAAREPLAIVLDDVHAADADSLSLLVFLAPRLRGGRLLVICTARDGEPPLDHPLAEALGALRRAGAMRLDLGGLSATALAELITTQVGSRPPDELIEDLHAGTEGNPLFVAEVTRLAFEQAPPGVAGDELAARLHAALPVGVRSAIAMRMSALSLACRELLVAAAVLGRDLSVARLRALADLGSDGAVLDAIEEAVRAGLLAERASPAADHELAHELVRDAVLARQSATWCARLHLRAADALERLYGDSADAHAAELAYHLEAAGALADPARVARHARLAAAQALDALAYQEAERLFRQALAVRGERGDEGAELLVGLARAELGTLGLDDRERFSVAVGRMRRAFDHYVAAGAVDRAVAIAAHPIPPIYRTTSTPDYRDLTASALAIAPPDSLARGRLLAASGWYEGANEADLETATQACSEAAAIARSHGDTALETRTLVNAAFVDFQHARWRDCLDRASAALPPAQRERDARAELFARIWGARSAMVLGDAAAAHEHVAAGEELARRLREPYWVNGAFLDVTWLAILEGRWTDARTAVVRALAAAPADTRALACNALIEYECGRSERGAEHRARLIDAYDPREVEPAAVANNVVAAFLPILGRLAGDPLEHLALARQAAERAYSSDAVHAVSHMMVQTGLGLTAVAEGDAEAAARHREALLDQAGTVILVAVCSADRLLGLLAATAGDRRAAERHLADAIAFCRRAGYRRELAWSAHDLAALSSPADAAPLLEEAGAIARELAMAALLAHLERPGRLVARDAGRATPSP